MPSYPPSVDDLAAIARAAAATAEALLVPDTAYVEGFPDLMNDAAVAAGVAAAAADAALGAANNAASLVATSTTTFTPSVHSQTVTTQSGKAILVGSKVILASAANPTTNYGTGSVTAYSGTSMTVAFEAVGASPLSASDWNISLSGSAGPTGATGSTGSTGSTGPTGPGYAATSTTSLAIASSGSKAFTTQAGLAYSAGARIRATSIAVGDYMEGLVTAYSGTTLTVTMDRSSGSGTHTDWNLNLVGDVGATGTTGSTGSTGTTGSTGPGYAATSTTSFAIASSGSKAFTTQAGLAYSAGARIRATSTAAGDYMEGVVTAYSSTTLTATMDRSSGSGTHTDWNINLVGDQGATGTTGTTGTTGSTGPAGPTVAPTWVFDTTTSAADPGSNKVRFNSGTASSISASYIDDNGPDGASIAALIDTWDDSTNTAYRGTLSVVQSDDVTKYADFQIVSVTNSTGYRTLALTYIAGPGGFGNGKTLSFLALRAGNIGASGPGGGDLVSTNNLSDVANATTARGNLSAAKSGANTDITSVLLNQTGLVVKGADSNALTIKPNETLTAARTLNVIVNDASRTFTMTGDMTMSGSFALTMTLTGTTNVTFPTAGTLATLAGSEALTNKTVNKVTITAPASGATLTIPDGVTLTGPAASGTAMTLGNAETVTGAKSFNDSTVLLKGSSSGTGTLKAPAAASTFVWTLPAATATLAGLGFAQTWSAAQTFNDSTLLLAGSSSGAGTLKAPAAASTFVWTLPAATVTLASLTGTETLTNKRVTPRRGNTTSSATPTINTDTVDVYSLTAQTVAITSMTTNLSGTPSHGDGLLIEVTGTAARAITWGTGFEASTIALPTTTVTTAMLSVAFTYNSATSKWRCVGVA